MPALREVFASFGFSFPDQGKLKQANSDVDKLKAGATALAAAFAGNALVNGIRTFAAELDTLDDLSAQTRIATDDLQVLGFAAELSGSSATEMNSALTLLQKSLGKTTEASGPQVEALTAMGVSLKDAAGAPRELAQVLPEIFAGFGGLGSQAEKAAVATALFGRSGVRLIPTLEKGTAGLADLKNELGELGGVVGGDTIKSAGEFRDNIARMDRAFFALKGTIASAVFPQLSKLITGFAKGVGKIADWVKHTTLADTATKALSATLALTLGKALAPYLGAGLKFAAIFLAVDDLLAFLAGKKSGIGTLLAAIFGVEAAGHIKDFMNEVIAMVKGIGGFVFEQIGDLISEIANGFPMVAEAWDRLTSDMKMAWLKFILAAIKLWNKIAPKKLQIDTSDVEKSLLDLQDHIDHIGFKKPIDPNLVPIEEGGNDPGSEFGTRLDANGKPIIKFSDRKENRGLRNKVDSLFGVPPPVATVPSTQNIRGGDVTINVNAPGMSGKDAKAMARELAGPVTDAMRGANRQSAQALTQRAK